MVNIWHSQQLTVLHGPPNYRWLVFHPSSICHQSLLAFICRRRLCLRWFSAVSQSVSQSVLVIFVEAPCLTDDILSFCCDGCKKLWRLVTRSQLVYIYTSRNFRLRCLRGGLNSLKQLEKTRMSCRKLPVLKIKWTITVINCYQPIGENTRQGSDVYFTDYTQTTAKDKFRVWKQMTVKRFNNNQFSDPSLAEWAPALHRSAATGCRLEVDGKSPPPSPPHNNRSPVDCCHWAGHWYAGRIVTFHPVLR